MGTWQEFLKKIRSEGPWRSRTQRPLPATAVRAPYLSLGKADSFWLPATFTLGRLLAEPPEVCKDADKCPSVGHSDRLNVTTPQMLNTLKNNPEFSWRCTTYVRVFILITASLYVTIVIIFKSAMQVFTICILHVTTVQEEASKQARGP